MINLNNEMAQIAPVLEKITKNSNETYENAWDMICDWEGRKEKSALAECEKLIDKKIKGR